MATSSKAPFVGLMSQCLVFAIAVVHLVLSKDYYYDPACSRGCSESNHKGAITYYSLSKDECEDELEKHQDYEINSQSLFPDVMIADYTTFFHDNSSSGNYEEFVGPWTAVNITLKYDPNVAGLVHGITFSMTSVSPDDPAKYSACRGYKFSTPLGIDEIQDDTGILYTHFFDCLRGQTPGFEYEYNIHLISNSSYGNMVYKLYYRSPACSFKPTDLLCTKNPLDPIEIPRLWRPQYFVAQSLDYEEVIVEFELAPEEYGFNEYEIAIADTERVKRVYVSSSEIHQTSYYGRNVSYIRVNLTGVSAEKDGEEISATLTPVPFPNTCKNSEGIEAACNTTYSRKFMVYENPCKTEYCGAHEVCKPLPPGSGHLCICKEGYLRIDNKCVEDVCNPTNPCGPGECNVTADGYTCQCNDGFVFHGNECKRDPCTGDPCQHGNCQLNMSSKDPAYNCDCDTDYIFDSTTCIEDVCVTRNPCGPNGKTCDVLSDPMCTCKYNYVYKYGKGCVVSPVIAVVISIACAAMIVLMLLVVYFWKNPDPLKRATRKIFGQLCVRYRSASVSECPYCHTKIKFAWKDGSPVYRAVKLQDGPPYDHMPSPHTVEMQHPQNDPVGPVIGRNTNQTIDISLMKIVKLLILSADDNLKHSSVVQALANFLQHEKNKFSVVLPSWCELDIAAKGWETWFQNKLNWADKVILVASAETQRLDNGHFRSCNSNFVKAVNHIINQYGSPLQYSVKHKFQVVYFEYSDAKTDIPPSLTHLPKYKLMKHMEALFFKLHDIEQYGAGMEREVSYMKEDNYCKESMEGFALYGAIQNMKKETCTNNNIENVNPHLQISIPQNTTGLQGQSAPKPQEIPQTGENTSQDVQLKSEYSDDKLVERHLNEQSSDNISASSRSSFDDAFKEVAGTNPHDVDFDNVYRTNPHDVDFDVYRNAIGPHETGVNSSNVRHNGCVVTKDEDLQRLCEISTDNEENFSNIQHA